MGTKIMKAYVFIILPFLVATALVMQATETEPGETPTQIESLKVREFYGPLIPADPNGVDIGNGLEYYKDNNYLYAVQEDGDVVSLVRFKSFSVTIEKDLTEGEAVAVAQAMIERISPGFFNSRVFSVSVERIRGGVAPWRVLHWLASEEGAPEGQVLTSIGRDGEVRELFFNIYAETYQEYSLPGDFPVIGFKVTSEQAIAIAYEAIADSPQGYTFTQEEKESHKVEVNKIYNPADRAYQWIVLVVYGNELLGLEGPSYHFAHIEIDSTTGEVLEIFPP